MNKIDEIVLRAGFSTVPATWLSKEKAIPCAVSNLERLVAFTNALAKDPEFLAELSKDAEPVVSDDMLLAYQTGYEQGKRDAVPEGWVLVPEAATEEMVSAYLHANRDYWTEHDKQQRAPDKWRNGTPQEATAESYKAMIAAAPKQEN